MKTGFARGLATAGVLGLAALLGPAVSAQVKPAVINPDGGGTEGTLRHGRKVTLNLKDGKKLTGTVVRSDRDSVFLRTAPGHVPVRVRRADVTDLSAKGIRPAGTLREEAVPEIHRVEIIEGPRRTVRYIAPTLSPGESAQLTEMEKAENEVARLEALSSLSQEVARQEMDVEASRQWAQRNFYNYSALSSLGFLPATVVSSPENGAAANYQPAYAYGPWFGRSLYSAYGPYYAYDPGLPFVPGLATTPATSPALAGSGDSSLKAGLLKQASPEALNTARADLERARSRAVFEGDRIVAVGLEDQSEYRPGDRVRVTPKKGNALTGTVERSDGHILILRTQPNMPPTTLRWQNIDMVEPMAVRPAGGEEEE